MARSLRATHSDARPSDEGDRALVARALAGEEAAYTGLFRRHGGYIAGVVYRMLGQDGDLDDIVQETFVEGLRQLGALKDPGKLRPFLVTIAVRRIYARMSLRYRMKAIAARLFGAAPAVSDPDAVAEVHAIYELLARVSPRHRVAWVLHRVEGHTLEEVAEQCGSSLATVKRWIAAVDRRLEEHDATD